MIVNKQFEYFFHSLIKIRILHEMNFRNFRIIKFAILKTKFKYFSCLKKYFITRNVCRPEELRPVNP